MSFDAVLFDFDGVLVDSEPVHYWAWSAILAGFGAQLTWNSYAEHCIGRDLSTLLQLLADLNPKLTSRAALTASYPQKVSLYQAKMLASPPVCAETIALVNELSLPLAVVTSNSRDEVEPVLEALGIRGRFAATVFREDVPRHKPAADPYLKAADILGVRRPLVVEDSEAGCRSAQEAGFAYIRVDSPRSVASLVREALSSGVCAIEAVCE